MRMTKRFLKARNKSLTWTIDGLVPKNSNKKSHEHNGSLSRSGKYAKQKDVDSNGTHLITVYENGSAKDPIIANAKLDDDSSGGERVFVDPLDELLEKSTNGLKLNSIVKRMYNWRGKLIGKSMQNMLTFNEILSIQDGHTEFAPLWASKGEKFNPSGALRFVNDFLHFEKEYLKDLREYEANIEQGKGKRGFNKREFETLMVNHLLHDYGDVYSNLKRLIEYLQGLLVELTELNKKYQARGSNYLMGHIKQIQTTDSIFGGPSSLGLLLQVYQNGTSELLFTFYFNRHTSTYSYDINMTLLMDEINRIYQNARSTTIRFTRAFKENGDEILRPYTTHWFSKLVNGNKEHTHYKDRENLKYGERIWVSAGENWRFPTDRYVTLTVFSLNVYNDRETQSIDFYAEMLRIADVKSFSKPNCWQCVQLNEIIKQLNENLVLNVKEKPHGLDELCKLKLNQNEIGCCLECMDHHEVILFPYLAFESGKEPKKDDEQTLDSKAIQKTHLSRWKENNFQVWSMTRDGYIYNHFLPQITLAIDTTQPVQLEIHIKGPNDEMHSMVFAGYCVVLSPKASGKDHVWGLNKRAQIFSKHTEEKMVLTSVHILRNRLENLRKKTLLKEYKFNSSRVIFDGKASLGATLLVMECFDIQNVSSSMSVKKTANFLKTFYSSQRWAIKEDGSKWAYPDGNFLPGQWKFSRLAPPEWRRMAYTWPIDEKNNIIEEFRWPLTGYLIAGPPPLKDVACQSYQRLSLKVLRNGEMKKELAVQVMTPDVKNLMDKHEHCVHMTLEQAEFHAFLECCTVDLGLPFAARRLFDSNGTEYFELHSLLLDKLNKVDKEVFYVSCGEPWVDTVLSAMENSSNVNLGKLIDDFKKIYHYCCLIHCKSIDLNIEADSLRDGASLSLQACILDAAQRARIKQGEPLSQVIQNEELEVVEEVVDTRK
jgi:hypothetical protein